METKKIMPVAGALFAIAVFGIGGYFVGVRSSQPPTSVYNNSGVATPVSQSANHSALVSDLEAQLEKNPNNVELLLALGDTYFDLKEFHKAVLYYKKASELAPDDADIYNDIGLSLHYTGNPAEGIKYIEEGAKKNPYHQRIWLTKGFVLAYGLGDLEGAAKAWDKARALDPQSHVGKAASEYLAQIVGAKEKVK